MSAMSDDETIPVEPQPITGFVDEEAARLQVRRDALLDVIRDRRAVSEAAMAEVKTARAELKQVERLLRATMPRGAKL